MKTTLADQARQIANQIINNGFAEVPDNPSLRAMLAKELGAGTYMSGSDGTGKVYFVLFDWLEEITEAKPKKSSKRAA